MKKWLISGIFLLSVFSLAGGNFMTDCQNDDEKLKEIKDYLHDVSLLCIEVFACYEDYITAQPLEKEHCKKTLIQAVQDNYKVIRWHKISFFMLIIPYIGLTMIMLPFFRND